MSSMSSPASSAYPELLRELEVEVDMRRLVRDDREPRVRNPAVRDRGGDVVARKERVAEVVPGGLVGKARVPQLRRVSAGMGAGFPCSERF
jgi:hypothetical protein